VEDQRPIPGDLSDEAGLSEQTAAEQTAAEPAPAAVVPARKRARSHRMPVGKSRRTAAPVSPPERVAEDETKEKPTLPDAVTDDAQAAGEAAATVPETDVVPEADDAVESPAGGRLARGADEAAVDETPSGEVDMVSPATVGTPRKRGLRRFLSRAGSQRTADAKTPTDDAQIAEDEARIAEDDARIAEDEARIAENEAGIGSDESDEIIDGGPEVDPVEGEEKPDDKTILIERKPARRWQAVAVAAAAVLFVGAGAFAGATVQPYLTDRALVDIKLDVARTAAKAITTLWTYTPDDMDTLPDRTAQYLGGDFESQYRKYVDAVAPTNKQAQVTNDTQVVGAAVESLRGPDAIAIVYTNSTSTSPLTKGIPSMRYVSYRLMMQRRGARWLVTKMTTITSLDVTPQL